MLQQPAVNLGCRLLSHFCLSLYPMVLLFSYFIALFNFSQEDVGKNPRKVKPRIHQI